MESLRRLYGPAEPIKRGMEVKMCADYRPMVLGGSSDLHKDILEGRDTTIEWEDIYKGKCENGKGKINREEEEEG